MGFLRSPCRKVIIWKIYWPGDEKPSAYRYNWAKLIPEDINMRTWPSRLGESEIQDREIWFESHETWN
jgi:hypothetical protein